MLGKICRVVGAWCMAGVLLCASGMPVMAAGDSVDLGRTGSVAITLHKPDGDRGPVTGGSFELWQVADVSVENGLLAYHGVYGFENSGIGLTDLRADDLAQKLADYARASGLSGVVQTADQNGRTVFTALPAGLYLVAQQKSAPGYYAVLPFVVSIPMTNREGTAWVYDVDASPKLEVRPNPPGPGGGSDSPDPPGSSTPPPVTEVTENPPPLSGLWPFEIPEEPVPLGGKLIQTGQLNWPVPVLAGVGILLFMMGWAMTFVKRDSDEA